MKKTTGVFSVLVIAIAAVTTAGAWYTGKQLPAELERSLAVANKQLKHSLSGTGGSVTLELVSLDQHLFTSTAHYRVKATDIQAGDAPLNFEVAVVDHLEHGPFPWSRVKALRLLPVMAASNAELQKDDRTAAWFAAAGGQSPVQAQVSLGYGGSVDSRISVLPLQMDEGNGNTLDFSGLRLRVDSDRDGQHFKLSGTADTLDATLLDQDQQPIRMHFKGFSLAGVLTRSGEAMVYAGSLDAALAESRFVPGAGQGDDDPGVVLKGLEGHSVTTASGDRVDGRVLYKIADISFAGRAVGAGEAAFSLKGYDALALQSLAEWYATRLPQVQAAQAAGIPFPPIDMTAQERAKVHADLARLLSGKPRIALENLSLKTAHGESRFSLSVDLANPASFDLPADQLARQVISQVQGKLTLSKPMIGDLATLQALLQGQDDAQSIARQAGQAGEVVGLMAVQSGLATVQGDDVVASLHYADGMVDFNGRKMTVEAFAMMLGGLLQGVEG
ncbi:MAG TPA: YdgA family protein [Pseudomonas sp.]|uniref:YdgA family protein n=1 Tax=Pseudomonas sp. TaxID=306 RepID=UPI002B488BE0|nr:YdgA family protein [Pseudomonas sp.]HKS12323.1 YdgA family protein [Pseudomonas sp.]